MIISEVRRP